jgi:hypothetical protein
MKNPWRDYNGHGKPITEAQLEQLLAKMGIYPRIGKDGENIGIERTLRRHGAMRRHH